MKLGGQLSAQRWQVLTNTVAVHARRKPVGDYSAITAATAATIAAPPTANAHSTRTPFAQAGISKLDGRWDSPSVEATA